MLQDIAPHTFDNHYRQVKPLAGDYLLCFRPGQVLLRQHAAGYALPRLQEYPGDWNQAVFCFLFDELPCFWLPDKGDIPGCVWIEKMCIRDSYGSLQELINAASGEEAVEITLLADVALTDSIVVPAEVDITINGNNKTISYDGGTTKVSFTILGDTREGVLPGTQLTGNDVIFQSTSNAVS